MAEPTVPEVLFVCVHNAGRSQMAAALLERYAAGRVAVRSAGSVPAETVNPVVIDVMNEIGIDVSREVPKKLHTGDVAAADVVITMGCGDACPIIPGKRYDDWSLTDPAGKGPDEVRAVRDEIDQRVRSLLSDLVPSVDDGLGRRAGMLQEQEAAMSDPLDRQSVHAEMARARAALETLVADASRADLRRPTRGTRWTNQQMLFHMVFGYMIVLRLLPLVRFFGRRPDRYSRVFSAVLNAGTRPFHVVNYLGSCGGAMVFHGPRLTRKCDRVIAALHRQLDRETDATLGRRMHFPVGWDPYFRDTMTLLDVYHYGTQHFDFHARQLTLPH